MIERDRKDELIAYSQGISVKISEILEVNPDAHPPGMGVDGVYQYVIATDFCNFNEWSLLPEDERARKIRSMTNDLYEKARKAKDQGLEKWPDLEIFDAPVHYLNILDQEFNPSGDIGRFHCVMRGVSPSSKTGRSEGMANQVNQPPGHGWQI